MPAGDCVLSEEFIHHPAVVQDYGSISNPAGQSPLPAMPAGDCVLSEEFIHRPAVVQDYGSISNPAGQSPLPVDGVRAR
jgi:hypothetical protein